MDTVAGTTLGIHMGFAHPRQEFGIVSRLGAIQTLGRYQIERALGRGSMGVVYEALDPKLHRKVAIKTILKSHLEEETAREYSTRFLREAQAVARLNHPNIVQVYDFGEEGDVAFLAMELIRGKELRRIFDASERFELREAMRIMCELLDALDFAHDAGIIHRDVKPGNVMLDAQARAKLTDFGVARVNDADLTHIEGTRAGALIGSPGYMSPEQVQGRTVDRRSDIFSAGVILYQFLTGQRPFTGENTWSVVWNILHEDPPAPSSIDASLPPEFDEVVNKALAKNPNQRYANGREFLHALQGIVEARRAKADSDTTLVLPLPPHAPGSFPPVAPAGKRSSLIAPVAVGVFAVAGGAAYFSLKPSVPSAVVTAPQTKSMPGSVAKPETASRQVAPAPGSAPAQTSPGEQQKRDTAERTKREADNRAKRDAEPRVETIAAREARERAKVEAEERARREAEIKREAEEKARIATAKAEPVQTAKATVNADALYRQALDMERTGKISDAVLVLKQAADAGSGPAAKRLGDIYGRGEGDVSRDYLESLKWYNLARQKGESVPTAKGR
jgi:serine/threonine protein kinase